MIFDSISISVFQNSFWFGGSATCGDLATSEAEGRIRECELQGSG